MFDVSIPHDGNRHVVIKLFVCSKLLNKERPVDFQLVQEIIKLPTIAKIPQMAALLLGFLDKHMKCCLVSSL